MIVKVYIYIFMLIVGCLTYAQNKRNEIKVSAMEYGSVIKINRGSTVVFSDGLSISPISFSHKNSIDRITRASVYIILAIENEKTEKFLSVYSDDDQKSEEELNTFEYNKTIQQENGMVYTITRKNHDRFIFWKNYQIQLKEFKYNQYIKIIATKNSK
ncbi:hypothetical protein [uncultured Aquimarina sp.]|uniref:hypothetical protein n=1 Tax=uncultured Aquimarina sp. TaxID=575652 RepID=UPI002632E9FA|nr:hypothetical protein [uncultured Aquimarina sp.]